MPHLFITVIAVIARIISNPLANVFQKQLTEQKNHPLLVNFLTYFFLSVAGLFFIPAVAWSALPAAFWWYAAAGGVMGAFGNGFLVKALHGGDLSVLGPVNAYKSVVGLVVAIFVLGEFPSWWGVSGIFLIVYGSYFVLDTLEEKFSWSLFKRKDIRYRIIAMILTAIEAVIIKKIIQYSSPSIAFLMWCWFGAVFAFAILAIYGVQIGKELQRVNSSHFFKYLFLLACLGTMQLTTNYVFDNMPVGYALSLFQLSTIVSILLGHTLFNEKNIGRKMIGAAIMIGGSVIIILMK